MSGWCRVIEAAGDGGTEGGCCTRSVGLDTHALPTFPKGETG